MKFEEFTTYADSIRKGCMNRLADMQESSDVEKYNWYAERHNDIGGRLMSLQVEYYNDDE